MSSLRRFSSSYLHKSILPSYFFQASLPSLPIPDLKVTLERYLRSLSPLVTPEAHAQASSLVAEFAAGDGLRLQAKLKENALRNPHTSYISEYWFDMYLTCRDPLPLNLNPQLTWRNDPRPRMQEQCARAANLAHASLRFHLTLAAGALDPEVYHMKPHLTKDPRFLTALRALAPASIAAYPMYALSAYPLDMSQYTRLFSSTRLPRKGRDELFTAPTPPTHIVVARGASLYRVEALCPTTGQPLSIPALEAAFTRILAAEAARAGPYAYPVQPAPACLTALPREAWAEERARLTALSSVNAESLATIDTALFFLSLDEHSPKNHEELSRAMLHGNFRNRRVLILEA